MNHRCFASLSSLTPGTQFVNEVEGGEADEKEG
jgi:hypothetical protein